MSRIVCAILCLSALWVLGCNSSPQQLTTPSAPASLTLTSKPTGAAIFLRGQNMNEATPHTFSSLSTGPIDVRLEHSGYDALTAHLTLVSGDTLAYSGSLLPSYVSPTSPDSVLRNLASALARRDTVQYAALLSADYGFDLRPEDQSSGGPARLTRGQELQFASALLRRGAGAFPPLAEADLTLSITSRAADPRPYHEGGQMCDVTTSFTGTDVDGNSFLIQSPAVMYFEPRPGAAGQWQLAEWVDVAALMGPRAAAHRAEPAGRAAGLTWGRLRLIYLGL